nr:MAG TPA: hypothetical protein [Caudoviricetes sp.]
MRQIKLIAKAYRNLQLICNANIVNNLKNASKTGF